MPRKSPGKRKSSSTTTTITTTNKKSKKGSNGSTGGSTPSKKGGNYTRVAWAGPKQELYQPTFTQNTKCTIITEEMYENEKFQINGSSRCVRYLTLGSPARNHEEAVLLTSRLSKLQNRHVMPAINQHGKSGGGKKDWILKFKCPCPGCDFEVTWCKMNKQAFAQNWPDKVTHPQIKTSTDRVDSAFFLETLKVHTCTDAEAEETRMAYRAGLDDKRNKKKEALQSPGGVVPKARVIDRFQAKLKIETMYPFVEKLLLTDPDMSSDGIACAISLIFGFDGELYRQVYYRRINECVGLFQMRWPNIRVKARRAATKGNPISNRGYIYKPDPDLVPNNDITHKAFGNVAPRKRAAKGSSSGSRKGSSSKSSGTSNRQRII